MASPRDVVFELFDASAVPLTGQAPSFTSYRDNTGTPVTPPAITELGGGQYKFTPVFPSNKYLACMIDGGASANPRYQGLYVRPEDYDVDLIGGISTAVAGMATSVTNAIFAMALAGFSDLTTFGGLMRLFKQALEGRVIVDPVAGTEKYYAEDDTTLLWIMNLRDGDDNPAGLNAIKRFFGGG